MAEWEKEIAELKTDVKYIREDVNIMQKQIRDLNKHTNMGLGGISRGSQMLFGGSGGQDFFEKATWTMGALFMLGALFITVIKTKETIKSRLSDYQAPISQATQQPIDQQNIQDTE